jgi:thioesterase domain-containing protein
MAARGFLERFRSAGTPGAAAGAGVPADRVAERDVELAGLFERLAEVEAAAAHTRALGREQARLAREDAERTRRDILAKARRDSDAERRDAAARITAQADQEARALLEAADSRVDAVRSHADAVLDEFVGLVLAEVAERLGVSPDDVARAAQASS